MYSNRIAVVTVASCGCLAGLFAGFSDASMDHFTINMGMGRQEVCGTYRMVLPAESALRCKEESPAGLYQP